MSYLQIAILLLLTVSGGTFYAKHQKTSKNTLKDLLLGKVNPQENSNFIQVEKKHLLNKKRTIYLEKKTYKAFQKMYNAAKKDGIKLQILSGFRSFNHQKNIWTKKWNTLRGTDLEKTQSILKYIAMPCTSRHHWGTDIDINTLNSSYFTKGKGKPIYQWLKKNAHKFGFVQTYQKKTPPGKPGRTYGYNEEPWHWSYIPQSKKLLKNFQHIVSHRDITGFPGAKLYRKLNIFDHYVKSINKK